MIEANGIPVNTVALQDSNLVLVVDAVTGSHRGKVSADDNTISGTCTQMDHSFPLSVKRVKDAADLERHRSREVMKPDPAARPTGRARYNRWRS